MTQQRRMVLSATTNNEERGGTSTSFGLGFAIGTRYYLSMWKPCAR